MYQSFGKEARFNDVCNAACRDLPDGWFILVDLEKGAGIVKLCDRHGGDHDFETDGNIARAVSDAISHAIDADRKLSQKDVLTQIRERNQSHA